MYYNLTSHINSLLRRRLFGPVRRNCLREPPKEKKNITPALKVILRVFIANNITA